MRSLLIPAFLAAALLPGCEGPVEPPDSLTQAEALALFQAITAGLELGLEYWDPPEPGAFDGTESCPIGGQVRLAGTITAEAIADTARIELAAVLTPTGCKVSWDELAFTVDGDPSISVELTMDLIGLERVVLGGGFEGKVRWQLGDRSGDCVMDMTLDAAVDLSDPDNPAETGSYTGEMCGHEIEWNAPD